MEALGFKVKEEAILRTLTDTKSSQDTALRDIQQLVDRGVLMRNPAGGPSTSYSLAEVS